MAIILFRLILFHHSGWYNSPVQGHSLILASKAPAMNTDLGSDVVSGETTQQHVDCSARARFRCRATRRDDVDTVVAHDSDVSFQSSHLSGWSLQALISCNVGAAAMVPIKKLP
jgi:hypothetical protein